MIGGLDYSYVRLLVLTINLSEANFGGVLQCSQAQKIKSLQTSKVQKLADIQR